MENENGVNNTPQTENQVVENLPQGNGNPPAGDPGTDLVGVNPNEGKAPESQDDDLTTTTDDKGPVVNSGERHIDEEVEPKVQAADSEISNEEIDAFFNGIPEEPLLTDEDILKKVAQAAYVESGHTRNWNAELSERERQLHIKAAKYFRDNPEAHPDQFHGLSQDEHNQPNDYYELPARLQEQAEAFAASVKNAYKA